MARACALLALASWFMLSAAHAQTMEIYAGGGRIRNTPGGNAPVTPELIAIAPDGMVYVTEVTNGHLLKFDPATGLATKLPGTEPEYPGGPPPQDFVLDTTVLAFGPQGELYGSTQDQLFLFNLQDGSRQSLWSSGWGGGADFQMAFDANGNLYYYYQDNAWYSSSNLLVRDPSGATELLKQVGGQGFDGDGGPLEMAAFTHPRGLARDAQGNLYISDNANHRVRRIAAIDGLITPQSIITTVAGNGDSYSYAENVPATATGLGMPGALALDSLGNLYVYEHGANRVRRISASDGMISTYVGNGEWGTVGDGGPASEASVDLVWGNIVFDAADNLYLADMGQMRVRRVDAATGIISTVLGNGTFSFCAEVSPRREACLASPQGMAIDSAGNVYVSDSSNQRIRRIDAVTGELRTVAGSAINGTPGGDGGPAIAATFGAEPGGIAFDAAGNLLIAGGFAHNIRRIDGASGTITTIAGTGVSGFAGDGGPATAARFNWVSHVLADSAVNVYLSDRNNFRIRKISASGIVTTIAGNGIRGFSGDGGAATAAMLHSPGELALDAAGNLYFHDEYRIRRIDAMTGVISTVAGNGQYQLTGDGGPATSAGLGFFSFGFDASGDIIVMAGMRLRRIDLTSGIIDAYGSPYGVSTPEGEHVQSPAAVQLHPDGGIFVVDAASSLLFRIEPPAPTVPDTTSPVITPLINGTPGTDDWYRSDISVAWHVADAESQVSASTGCSATTVTSDTAGITLTCSATSAGGTSSRSVTVRRDTVAPTLSLDGFNPAVDEFGWRTHPASAWFYAYDALSGLQSTSPNPTMINEEGAGVSVDITATDRAGNSTTISTPPINQDFYPPVIAATRMGATGNDGWYTQDVRLYWQVIEEVSPIRSEAGCDDPLLNYDTAAVTFTCTATSAGGTATSSITLKRDTTPPTLTFGPPSPAPNASGWHTGDVSFSFTTADGTSGVASTSSPGPLVITGEGAGLTASVTVTDSAGNTATFTTPPVNIDRSTLTVTPVVAGTPGNQGWYRSDVQVSWALTGNVLSSSGCATSTVDTDTAGVTFTCSATSPGGTVSNSVTIKRDATPPSLIFGTPSPAPNANGWNTTNVSVPFTHSDALSGIASVSVPSPVVLSTEGAAVTANVTVTDLAGNAATFTTVPRNIDKTRPVVVLNSPAQGASYGFYQDVIADYSCTDLALAICTAQAADGALVNTRAAGARTFTATGKDLAGISASVTHNFTVASQFNFEGFLAPMNGPPTLNLVSPGTLVPIRWRLPDGNGGFVTNPASFASATVSSLACDSAPVVPLTDTASGPRGINFDAASSTFTYNWQTDWGWSGCRRLTLRLRDNSVRELHFRFQ
jgi:sugar lactone lactonase YvrE